MSQLSDLQQSDPTKFKQVASEISTKLTAAAKSASDSGNTDEANALTDLANKFKTSSQDGTMPDLKPANGGPMGPPPGAPPTDSSSSSSSSTDGTSSSSSSTDTSSSSSSSSSDLSAELVALLKKQVDGSGDPMSTLAGILQSTLSTLSS